MTAPIVLRPGEGETTDLAIAEFSIKADSEATNGAYSFVEASGTIGATPHVHHGHEEAYYVVEGSVTFLLGDDSVTVEAGSFVLVPRETMHAFRSEGEARLLILHSPGGFEEYFRRAFPLLLKGELDTSTRDRLADEVGMTYHDDVEF